MVKDNLKMGKYFVYDLFESDCVLAQSSSESKVQYGNIWMRKTLQTRQAHDRSTGNPHDELRNSLESPLETVENVVAWWGVSHSDIVSSSSMVWTYFIM